MASQVPRDPTITKEMRRFLDDTARAATAAAASAAADLADFETNTLPGIIAAREDNVRSLVKYFGAVGDGSADETSAFDDAFAWLNATPYSGRTLLLSPGYFLKTGTHTITVGGAGITGSGGSTLGCYILQNDNNTSVAMSAVNPANTSYGNRIHNIGFWRQETTTASGTDLHVTNQAAMSLRGLNFWRAVEGLRITGCGGLISDIDIGENVARVGTVSGAALLRIEALVIAGVLSVTSSELNINNFNIRGNVGNIPEAIHITGCDGVFFSNGHCGFAINDAMLLEQTAIAGNNIQNVNCSNVYFDGFSTCGLRVESANTGRTISNHTFTGCTFRNHADHGVFINQAVTDTTFTGCLFGDNGGWGMILNGGANTKRIIVVGNAFNANTSGHRGGDATGSAGVVIASNGDS